MRSTLAIMFLAVVAGNATAAWTVINSVDGSTEYVDKDSVRRSANTVKMWTLTDYETPRVMPSGDRYSSTVALREFDCAESRTRVLQTSANEGKMREGKRVFSTSDPWEWAYAEPGTVGEIRQKIACKKK